MSAQGAMIALGGSPVLIKVRVMTRFEQ